MALRGARGQAYGRGSPTKRAGDAVNVPAHDDGKRVPTCGESYAVPKRAERIRMTTIPIPKACREPLREELTARLARYERWAGVSRNLLNGLQRGELPVIDREELRELAYVVESHEDESPEWAQTIDAMRAV
jgi:hypothetical protein